MKLEVDRDSVVTAEIDLPEFKKELKKTLDIETSFNKLVRILTNKTDMEEDEVKRQMFIGTNWGQVMKVINTNKAKTVKIGLNMCTLTEFVQFTPAKAIVNGKVEYNFEEREISGEEYMVFHSFIPLMEHHVDKLLSDMIFDYADTDFQREFVDS